MKDSVKSGLLAFCCLLNFPAFADDPAATTAAQESSNNTKDLVNYLKNLGGFFGYDISQAANPDGAAVSAQLLSQAWVTQAQTALLNTFLGALPVNGMNQSLAQILPPSATASKVLNAFANYVYAAQPYNNPSSTGQQNISVSPLIDQAQYQPDPVSQGILNILITPNDSYCLSADGLSIDSNKCGGTNATLTANQVSINVMGSIPKYNDFMSYDYAASFLGQLNVNTLLGPMLYGTESQSDNTSSNPGQNASKQTLTAHNQAQSAANFIRYASGTLTPLILPDSNTYNTLYMQANSLDTHPSPLRAQQAKGVLAKYATNLRNYAAQYSVALGNLYAIFSKRMPQNVGAAESGPSSQAASEFKMATWRLFNADSTQNQLWTNQINNASAATVQKEMAILMAEINYQLYLNRQQEERLLLTQSMLLIQNMQNNQPNLSPITTEPGQ